MTGTDKELTPKSVTQYLEKTINSLTDSSKTIYALCQDIFQKKVLVKRLISGRGSLFDANNNITGMKSQIENLNDFCSPTVTEIEADPGLSEDNKPESPLFSKQEVSSTLESLVETSAPDLVRDVDTNIMLITLVKIVIVRWTEWMGDRCSDPKMENKELGSQQEFLAMMSHISGLPIETFLEIKKTKIKK